ncbi:putative thioesterase [uncultured Desulfobacterium sp.]|uniref:Putative thioesterase n=1 Tax=uncultured Desulfobacterium sp. TaxID=201089 RepID=A0A445N381_9BACT|nr:putative thioesterase [uncultured Desulfobacterium sp.]
MPMSENTPKTAEIRLKVPFHDLDPAQIVWHGNYLRYFDMARFTLFKEAGVDLYDYFTGKRYAFPVIKTSTKHIAPLKYGDEFICRVTVLEARIKISLGFEIMLAESGLVCTRGMGDQVAVKMPEMELQLEIPFEIRKALGFG